MKRLVHICGLAVLMLPVFSCTALENPDVAALQTDSSSLTIPADIALLGDPFDSDADYSTVTDTVWVSSSRSWSASVKTGDGGNWISLSTRERINVSGKEEKYPLVLTLNRNKFNSARTATLTIAAAEVEAHSKIEITQEAFVPSLEVSAWDNPVGLDPKKGECYIIVKSNTSWTVGFDAAASSVTPDFSAIAGKDTRAVLVSFPTNVNDEQAQFATVEVKADKCDPQRIELFQSQSNRFFYLDGDVPEDMEPYDRQLHVPLLSNGPWTAEISDCTFENAKLTPSSGNYTLSGFNFSANHGFDPKVTMKEATITIRRDGMDPIVLHVRQRGSIHLNFGTFDPEYEWNGNIMDIDHPYAPYIGGTNPFYEPSTVPGNYNNGTNAGQVIDCKMNNGGFVFTMYGKDCGVWFSKNTTLWCIGKTKDDYVLFPGIEGWRLEKMYYEASCRVATPYTIRTEDGERIIPGGELTVTSKAIPNDREHHDMHVHVFPDTEAGARYRLNLEETLMQISLKDLCLIYEKVN